MKLLLEAGAEPERKVYGRSALHHAMQAGMLKDCQEVISWLILNGAPVNDACDEELTPLHLACN